MSGKNKKFGLYTPMSETEQDALSRLVENQDLVVHILGWGRVDAPRVLLGDLRLGIHWRMDFTKPAAPTPVHFFDLELKTRSGTLLFKERQTAMYGGKPLAIANGVFLDMAWDIAITAIDPKLVKHILPNAHGLTSRFQDKDTHEITMFGNILLSAAERAAMVKLRRQEAASRVDTRQQTAKAEKAAQEAGVIRDPSKMGTGKDPS
jgi:hypothetical protein